VPRWDPTRLGSSASFAEQQNQTLTRAYSTRCRSSAVLFENPVTRHAATRSFRSKMGATRFRELTTEVPLYNIGSSDQRGVAEFFFLLGPEHFGTYVAELVVAREPRSFPSPVSTTTCAFDIVSSEESRT